MLCQGLTFREGVEFADIASVRLTSDYRSKQTRKRQHR